MSDVSVTIDIRDCAVGDNRGRHCLFRAGLWTAIDWRAEFQTAGEALAYVEAGRSCAYRHGGEHVSREKALRILCGSRDLVAQEAAERGRAAAVAAARATMDAADARFAERLGARSACSMYVTYYGETND